MPGKDRASGDEALLFLGSVRDHLTIVTLDAEERLQTVESAAAYGVRGGGVCDALVGQCVLKAKAQSLYTWNARHFKRLGPDIAGRVKTP